MINYLSRERREARLIKYDVLDNFRNYLKEKILNKNTADRYYFAVEKIFKDMTFSSSEEISKSEVEKILLELKGKSNFSAAKNGLKHFSNFDSSFKNPTDSFFSTVGKTKRNRSIKPPKTLNYESITKKINSIANDKLKVAYRLMMFSGLRVSETAQLLKKDISFPDEETVKINVLHGKGGSNGEVVSVKNKLFAQSLKQYIETCPEEKPFYAAKTMKNKAGEIDLECHDFRRVASQLHKKEAIENGSSAFDANDSTREFLRHKRFSTTKRYLMNRKLEFELPKKDTTDVLPSFLNLFPQDQRQMQSEIFNNLTDGEQAEYLKVVQAEPAITNILETITSQTGGYLAGLEYRLKTPASVYEKIYSRKESTPIGQMNDILRYTGIYASDKLSASTFSSLEQLGLAEFKVAKIKNAWLNKDSPYKGINVTFKQFSSGQLFEMQYHTKESFDLKNGALHSLYEQARLLDAGDTKLPALQAKMKKLSETLTAPLNIEDVKEPHK